MGRARSLVAIDPGGDRGHTGVVRIEYTPDTLPRLVSSCVLLSGWEGIADWVPEVADTIVIERFVDRHVPGADTSVLLTEGALLGAYRRLGVPVVRQPASGKNTAVPNAVLKQLGMWITGDHHHDRTEAARHALLWLRKQRHVPTLEAILDC